MDNQQIGHMIRMARTEKGWSQQQLADEFSCSQSQVSKMERGAVRFYVEDLQRLAEILEKSVCYFLLPVESGLEELDQVYQIMRSLPASLDRDTTVANMLAMARDLQRRG